jgi:hypothetical protein
MVRDTRASGEEARPTAEACVGTSTASATTASGKRASDPVHFLGALPHTHYLTRTLTGSDGEGKGTFYWSNGSYYVGKWRDDKPVGQGVHWCASTKTKTKRGWSNEFLCCCATATVLTPMKETTTGTPPSFNLPLSRVGNCQCLTLREAQ